MPADDRQDAIDDAVEAYNHAHPTETLPRSAARLLGVMFADGDSCQRSLNDIALDGFSRKHLPRTLQRLVLAGFLSRQQGSGVVPDTYHLHLPPVRR